MLNRLCVACGAAGLLLVTAILGFLPLRPSAAAEADLWAPLQQIQRTVPTPLEDHPGNVYLEGETVVVPMPDGIDWDRFRVLDDAGEVVAEDARPDTGLSMGALPIGWYRFEFLAQDGTRAGWTAAAVLARLAEPTPQDSPICIDTAAAWFAHGNAEKQRQFAALAALAGVNWARDRLSWDQIATERGVSSTEETTYDTSAGAAVREGLKALQVFHSTPEWAQRPDLEGERPRNRFPRDLRDLYTFCKDMAERFDGQVLAWEPWNEANIEPFGGHLIDEMCSLQKAAYFAFKAGNPDVTVCWNVYAGSGSRHHTEGVLLNEAWPYFETYNIHTYSAPEAYLSLFEGPRDAASGRPIWLTECGIRLYTEDAHPWGDLTPEDEIRQAEFIAHSYATSLFSGVNRHFFFILGNYIERGVQFGLLRHDLTPRPGYSALAAVGRLLAGAQPLGRLCIDEPAGTWVYAFRARPGGIPADVLVAWSDVPVTWEPTLEQEPVAVYDYLGREQGAEAPIALSPKAVFVVVSEGAAANMPLEPPPPVSAFRPGDPCPVVVQAELPQDIARLGPQAYELPAGEPVEIPLWVYNFSNAPVSGRLAVEEAPDTWAVRLSSETMDIEPYERRPAVLQATLAPEGHETLYGAWLRLRGDFGDAGEPVFAFRLIGERASLTTTNVSPITGAADPERWELNIVGGATMSHRAIEDGAIAFSMQFGDTDPWAYPRLWLEPGERPEPDDDGFAVTVHLAEGEGAIRVQFIKENGAVYITNLAARPGVTEPQRVIALFGDAHWASHSRPDPDGELRPEHITGVMVGINSERGSRAELVVSNPAWVRY